MKLNNSGSSIKINSTNIDLGEVLPRKIQEELLHAAETYFGYLNHATVGFTRDGHWYCCTINAQVSNLKVFVAEASATDCHKSFDLALEKIAKQLRRRKRRIVDANRGQMAAPALA
ncbi:HPF/RaiA family ribosome-associated protein [Microvirga subterranea]|uniref:Ribosomal subunit interface protein n=1 Tax=Microvirga subterranea TaxID=186651 RepID=A0A370H8V9_9HYPH|nr:HPF/RaiA family ribosome-associated protein [Microvirga subterranea]RDI52271.1 ribosomal subunit interface protein [Microvirga subterranea]